MVSATQMQRGNSGEKKKSPSSFRANPFNSKNAAHATTRRTLSPPLPLPRLFPVSIFPLFFRALRRVVVQCPNNNNNNKSGQRCGGCFDTTTHNTLLCVLFFWCRDKRSKILFPFFPFLFVVEFRVLKVHKKEVCC